MKVSTIKYNKMRVGTLRGMLYENGLDVVGSREAMITTIREMNNEQSNTVFKFIHIRCVEEPLHNNKS